MAETVKYTPGPWETFQLGTTIRIRASQGVTIASVSHYRPSAERYANARLIAAAPDMVEALRACIAMYGDENPDDDWTAIKKARAAIAKATGADT